MKNSKVLILVTNHSDFEKANVDPTGLWLSELTHFYDVFEANGIGMDIISPKGGKIPIDPRSLGRFGLDKHTKKRYEDTSFMSLLDNTKSLSDVDWKEYDVLFFAGGHGAMWDFANDQALHAVTRDMFEAGKIVAAVCHGVAALQNVKLSNGDFLVKGRKGTCFTYFDESVAGVKKIVPYNLEKTLKDKGMIHSKSVLPLGKHSVVDGNLITGQNPNSATDMAEKTLDVLRKMKK